MECIAVLSGIIAHDTLRTFLDISVYDQQHITVLRDNIKLVKNLIYFLKYHMTANNHILPDFNIIYEKLDVVKSIRKQGRIVSFKYVNDKKKKNTDSNIQLLLLHEEEMHSLAHKVAQQAKSLKDKKYIPFPNKKVNLIINDHFVNADVNKIATKFYHRIKARKFFKKNMNGKIRK